MADDIAFVAANAASLQASIVKSGSWSTSVVAAQSIDQPASFDKAMQRTGLSARMSTESVSAKPTFTPSARDAAINKNHRAFETIVLQGIVSAMLPNDPGGKFSAGSAGRMWKSVMAEKIAEKIAERGTIKLIPDAAFADAMNPDKTRTASAQPPNPTWQTTTEVTELRPVNSKME